ncbi:MAG TPA: hypothetical protein DEF34_00830 [Desulfotomaculum sp.]|nr:MAG: hypothetical protein JL56_08140 [Desulfotomaculum sp. BICA1-6]HBX22171.1 hypothetical protein [Desulfotomaculum sp.]
MKISSSIVGSRLKEYSTTATWRQTTNYAAALNDMNPCYFDDTGGKKIMAPPMFTVALTWPIMENLNEFLASPYPREVLHTIVHYMEHIEFFQPVLPGDRLKIQGEVAAVLPRTSGTLFVVKFTATDAAGKLVFTEHFGSLFRGVGCDSSAGTENIPNLQRVETEGRPVWEAPVNISAAAPYIYDGCTNIVFPIHTSPQFAAAVGLPGIIYQGTATLAHAARELVNREGDSNPERLKVIAGRFTGMVLPGSTIRVQLLKRSVNGKDQDLFFRVLNEQGQEAISSGYAKLG